MRIFKLFLLVLLFITGINTAQTLEYLGLEDQDITSLCVNYNLLAVGTDSNGVFWKNESLLEEDWNNIQLYRKVLSVYPHKSGPIGWAISAGVEKSLSDSGLIYCSYLGGEFVSNSAGIDYEHSFSVIDIDGFPDPTICGETFAVTGSELYKREFADTVWTKIKEVYEGNINTVKAKINYPGVVMIGGAAGFAGILLEKSTDFGDTWNNISPFGAVTDIDFIGDSAEVIFAAAYPDVFRSTDNGASWEKIFRNNQFLIFDNILYDSYNQFLFVSGFEGIMSAIYPVLLFSNDMGDTWQRIELSFRDEIVDLEYSSNGGDWIYLATRSNGVFRFKANIVAVDETNNSEYPAGFRLYANYPNPFNPTTTIQYFIPSPVLFNSGTARNLKDSSTEEIGVRNDNVSVSLKVYDILGREVAELVNEYQKPGKYIINFDGTNLTSGIYYYRLTCGDNSLTRKMLLIK